MMRSDPKLAPATRFSTGKGGEDIESALFRVQVFGEYVHITITHGKQFKAFHMDVENWKHLASVTDD